MNITPHINPLPVATAVNPPTDLLRHENTQRPVIIAPTQTSGSPAEKGTADKNKASNQSGESFDFVELQKSAEKSAEQITENSEQGNRQNSQSNNEEANAQANQDENQANSQEVSAEGSQENPLEKVETAQNEKVIQELQQRDQEVRAHEQAHASVGGAATGTPSYEFEVGPDGKKYAVSGEVSADLSPVSGDPQATITKMEQVYAAALAPANPSTQDIKVAAQASEIILQAQADLFALGTDESEEKNKPSSVSPYIESTNVFNENTSSALQSKSFDEQISKTLNAQEQIAPTLSSDVKARAERIEGYYSTITQAYEKEPLHQFELTV